MSLMGSPWPCAVCGRAGCLQLCGHGTMLKLQCCIAFSFVLGKHMHTCIYASGTYPLQRLMADIDDTQAGVEAGSQQQAGARGFVDGPLAGEEVLVSLHVASMRHR